MKIERIIFGEYRANSYLVYENNKAILIDASLNFDKLKELLTKNKLELEAIFITHAHFDHIINLQEIIKNFKAKVYIHKNGLKNIQDKHKNMSDITNSPFEIIINENFVGLEDGSKVRCLNGKVIECFETIGHCESSMCFKLENILFTGDTLFYGTCGRCDLWDSNVQKMISSLNKIKQIEKVSAYYPGHGYSMNYENAIKTIEFCINNILN